MIPAPWHGPTPRPPAPPDARHCWPSSARGCWSRPPAWAPATWPPRPSRAATWGGHPVGGRGRRGPQVRAQRGPGPLAARHRLHLARGRRPAPGPRRARAVFALPAAVEPVRRRRHDERLRRRAAGDDPGVRRSGARQAGVRPGRQRGGPGAGARGRVSRVRAGHGRVHRGHGRRGGRDRGPGLARHRRHRHRPGAAAHPRRGRRGRGLDRGAARRRGRHAHRAVLRLLDSRGGAHAAPPSCARAGSTWAWATP